MVNVDGKGYGSAGASRSKRSTRGFTAQSGSPREDIDLNNYTLRQRGRLMYMGNPVAASAIKTHRTNTVGLGLNVNPRINADFLGLGTEQAEDWKKAVKREFGLWTYRKNAVDMTGMNNFWEMQQMLLTSWLATGDVFVLVKEGDPIPNCPYTLRLQAVEGDRVATPSLGASVSLPTFTTGRNDDNGNKIYDGVEVDGNGRVAAYWFRSTYPGELIAEQNEFTRVEAYGRKTGLPNVLHIMATERPEQYRGVTYLAPAIAQLLNLNRYAEAELTAAIIQAFLALFVQTEMSDMLPFNEAGGEKMDDDPDIYEMGPATVITMKPGEKISAVDPTRPSSSFQAFSEAVCTQIGASLEIPKDILLKTFNASYSASRGALLEAWKSFRMWRSWFVNDFCDPVYELWLTEAVARGRIQAPGFFDDPAVHDAWLECEWIGPSQGMLDPVKEINAEALACQNGFSTRADSALRLNGSDFGSNVEQLTVENAALNAAVPKEVPAGGNDNDDFGGDGDGEDRKSLEDDAGDREQEG